ncbi:MAG: DUF2726 domain-containing protein [bacterium]
MSHVKEVIQKTYPNYDGERIHDHLTFTRPYLSAKFVLNLTELRFYNALVKALPHNLLVCPKVRLLDILRIPQELTEFQQTGLRYRIQAKHVDFLICDSNAHILFAIEVDGPSHQHDEKVKDRDTFVNSAFASSRIPLLHVDAMSAYYNSYMNELINKGLTENKKLHSPQESMVS